MKVKFGNRETEIPMELVDLVKTEGEALTPASGDLYAKEHERPNPVHAFVAQAALKQQTEGVTTTSADFDICKAILADADVRDQKPPVVTLRKDSSVPDWSWSSPVSTDAPLEKRAHETAKERFREQLEKFFAGHNDEFWEARGVCDQALDDERAAILAGETLRRQSWQR